METNFQEYWLYETGPVIQQVKSFIMSLKNLFEKTHTKSNLQTIFLGELIMTKPAASFNNSCMMAKATYELLIMLCEFF